MVQPTPAATLENLSRLASKPGVQSTLILSKSDGSIIRRTGLLAAPSPTPAEEMSNGTSAGQDGSGDSANEVGGIGKHAGTGNVSVGGNSAEDVARKVLAFVAGAKAFTEEMDQSDEVKLLRLRTRRNEIVIVPDSKFLLVVVHDTPPA